MMRSIGYKKIEDIQTSGKKCKKKNITDHGACCGAVLEEVTGQRRPPKSRASNTVREDIVGVNI